MCRTAGIATHPGCRARYSAGSGAPFGTNTNGKLWSQSESSEPLIVTLPRMRVNNPILKKSVQPKNHTARTPHHSAMNVATESVFFFSEGRCARSSNACAPSPFGP